MLICLSSGKARGPHCSTYKSMSAYLWCGDRLRKSKKGPLWAVMYRVYGISAVVRAGPALQPVQLLLVHIVPFEVKRWQGILQQNYCTSMHMHFNEQPPLLLSSLTIREANDAGLGKDIKVIHKRHQLQQKNSCMMIKRRELK